MLKVNKIQKTVLFIGVGLLLLINFIAISNGFSTLYFTLLSLIIVVIFLCIAFSSNSEKRGE